MEWIPIDLHIKMSSFTAEINVFHLVYLADCIIKTPGDRLFKVNFSSYQSEIFAYGSESGHSEQVALKNKASDSQI